MFNVRLAGDHLYVKWLFTWLSLVMPLVVSCFVLSFFPRDVLDEIWDRIRPVPEYFSYLLFNHTHHKQSISEAHKVCLFVRLAIR